jgi:predicted nicotinamide N-methyase
MKNLEYNIDINANRPNSSTSDWVEKVEAMTIDWDDESTWPKEKMDVVIGSDLIYQKSIVPLLKKVITGLLKEGGLFLYSCPTDGRAGLPQFLEVMKKEGFKCEGDEIAPDLYRTNPLSNGDADDAFLHFYELPVTEYKLFEFRKL